MENKFNQQINFRGTDVDFGILRRAERSSLREEKDEKFFYFDLRHGDDISKPITLEKFVSINYFGTIRSKVNLLGLNDMLELTDDEAVAISYL